MKGLLARRKLTRRDVIAGHQRASLLKSGIRKFKVQRKKKAALLAKGQEAAAALEVAASDAQLENTVLEVLAPVVSSITSHEPVNEDALEDDDELQEAEAMVVAMAALATCLMCVLARTVGENRQLQVELNAVKNVLQRLKRRLH